MSGFKTQAICFTEQYARFEMPMIQKAVDGNNTLADNVCDNSALRLSWLAYQLWSADHGPEPGLPGLDYTIQQIFYMTYGQVCVSFYPFHTLHLHMGWEGFSQFPSRVHHKSSSRLRHLDSLRLISTFTHYSRSGVKF